jgi:hypothetical protein
VQEFPVEENQMDKLESGNLLNQKLVTLPCDLFGLSEVAARKKFQSEPATIIC